ncbi:MAG: prepilin-type N-terminal cleavage/methylation domain-containing protein [Candidatus Wildermuthbacteria bacterium]|nr:prepilin-type N-terminal cleavage/methylation domain-containing protein [Candidatus Wildermuthbacteria bacterium]
MNKGFTLVEILVYLALLVLVIGAVLSFLLFVADSQVALVSRRSVTLEGSGALEFMAKEIREARSIYTPTSVLDLHPGQLSLETKKAMPEGEQETFVDFFLCEERLCMKRESQTPIALTSPSVKVVNLVFRQVLSGSIPSLRVELGLSSNENQTNFSQAVSLRVYEAP